MNIQDFSGYVLYFTTVEQHSEPPAIRAIEQTAWAPAMGHTLLAQLDRVIREADKDLDPVGIKVKSIEVDARIGTICHDGCSIPLSLAVLVLICSHHAAANERAVVSDRGGRRCYSCSHCDNGCIDGCGCGSGRGGRGGGNDGGGSRNGGSRSSRRRGNSDLWGG